MLCISQGFKGLDICRTIAAIGTSPLKTGADDITSFDEGFILQLCWSYVAILKRQGYADPAYI
jgi:hypothetical protein